MLIKSDKEIDLEMKELLAIKIMQDENLRLHGSYEPIINKKKKKRVTWSKLFQKSDEWKQLRNEFMSESNKTCVKCGAKEKLQVDHIKPKSKYRELALCKNNLQILCWDCNSKKSAKY